jgi:hypothetical protein
MDTDSKLVGLLLDILLEREGGLVEGDSVLVQPDIEGQHVPNGVAIKGYDHEQIDRHLRLLNTLGFVTSKVRYDSPGIGIYFSRLTPRGRELIRAR